jgi:UDP-N-acetylglucosamine:LPS N-acetylglucosamine transferase
VVADAPPLATAAAAMAGVRSVVCGNFTWDWIYEAYREHLQQAPALIPQIQEAYRHAAFAWRLPMHGGFATFAPETIVDVPFVARHARRTRTDVRRSLQLPADTPVVLFSFGGMGVKDVNLWRLDCLDRYAVVLTTHEAAGAGDTSRTGVHVVSDAALYGSGLRYEDLVAASDVVLTKPGYGIISECVANEVAVLYTSRGRFAEYDVLVESMPQFARAGFIEQAELFGGHWRDALDAVLRQPPPPIRPATNGADVIAGMILEHL